MSPDRRPNSQTPERKIREEDKLVFAKAMDLLKEKGMVTSWERVDDFFEELDHDFVVTIKTDPRDVRVKLTAHRPSAEEKKQSNVMLIGILNQDGETMSAGSIRKFFINAAISHLIDLTNRDNTTI